MVHDTVVVDDLLAVHEISFCKGAGTVHSIADDNNDIVFFYARALNDFQQRQQDSVFTLVRDRSGDIGDGDTNR